jgi:rhodanese-related sulfurtransferase
MGFFERLFRGDALSPQEAKAEMDSGIKYTLLDVRSSEEFRQGHIPNARSIPLNVLSQRVQNELPDKEIRILVYCSAGHRGVSAVRLLKQLGYENAISIGGILNWPYQIVR